MSMTTNIVHFFMGAPKRYKEMYEKYFDSPERIDYHPEGKLGVHINITQRRAHEKDCIDLKMIAALHDICKGMQPVKSKGGLKTITMSNGESCTYHSNPDHAYQAGKFIRDNEDIQRWITDSGANLEDVITVVENHMKHKSYINGVNGTKGGMKASKRQTYEDSLSERQLELLNEFSRIDNMLEKYIPNKNLFPLNEKFAF